LFSYEHLIRKFSETDFFKVAAPEAIATLKHVKVKDMLSLGKVNEPG